jgi:CheY-like chemotaxis protein
VVVLDLQMPDMNALETQSALTDAGWNVPVEIITAHSDPGARERCLAAGALA